MRVLIADDQALMRSGIRMILTAHPDIEVAGEAGDGREAVDLVRRLRPDVVLMDIRMPRLDGIEATRQILATEGLKTAVLVLTTFDDDDYIFEALRAGARGFLLKTAPSAQLLEAIHIAARGDAVLAPSVTRRLLAEFAALPPRVAPGGHQETGFTEREVDVLKLVARGLSNQEIGDALHVSEATVKSHVGHMLGKLGLRDRVQLVINAYENGLIRPTSAS